MSIARHPFSQDAKNQANTTLDLGDCRILLNSVTWSMQVARGSRLELYVYSAVHPSLFAHSKSTSSVHMRQPQRS
jgi:hypothetical protein